MLKPLGDTLFIEPMTEVTTNSGLILKFDYAPKLLLGKVIAVGDSDKLQDINVGDVIYYHKFAGKPVKHDNKFYKVINVVEVQAVVR